MYRNKETNYKELKRQARKIRADSILSFQKEKILSLKVAFFKNINVAFFKKLICNTHNKTLFVEFFLVQGWGRYGLPLGFDFGWGKKKETK